AQDARFDVPGQGMLTFGEQPSPAAAFNRSFGTDFTDDQYADALFDALMRQENGYGQSEAGEADKTPQGLQRDSSGQAPSGTPEGTREDRERASSAEVARNEKPLASRDNANELSPEDTQYKRDITNAKSQYLAPVKN